VCALGLGLRVPCHDAAYQVALEDLRAATYEGFVANGLDDWDW
jgi:hypothetical protein